MENLKNHKSETKEIRDMIHSIYNKYNKELLEETKQELLESYVKLDKKLDIYYSTVNLLEPL